MSSMDWRSHVSTDERLASILRIVELAHAVQPFNEVLNRAKQAEAGVFQRATSRENYLASMEQLVSYMKRTIEDKTKQHLEELAENEYKLLSGNQPNDNLSKSLKTEHEEQEEQSDQKKQLKNLWNKRIEEMMEQLRLQQQAQSQRLYLLLQNLQLQQLLQQKKTRQIQSTNITPLLQQQILLPQQPTVSVLQTNLSSIQQPINPLLQQPTIILQTSPQFYQPQTYSFQHQPMTLQQQQLFTLAQPSSFTLQPLITQQHISTPLKCEQSQSSSLPQDTKYYLVKDANIHKEDFKKALKLPINEQKRHPPPGEPVIPVHALKVEGSDSTSHHQFKQNCQ